ncbi:polysaccharide pyruvyl transferase family protein [Nitrosospira multiformis]|uniref:Pyruvyl transferase EpsO n=1 Tax=Nitrosospira multiformis TaxID=1231 RepID=A0A1I7IRG7_9PROT|nr:polysaccharide pyruvyl transferase family protein [Nitrosospira multiformis]SFU75530.1 pyruvyl transferase EpsO [Nitrosospira multiformis]
MTLIDKTKNNETHAELMRSLADKHGVLAALIGTAPVHYVDVPVHGNIGDLLILLGTLRFFERYKLKIHLKTTYFTYRSKWARPSDVIVFHGGGNFGDLYSGPHEMRQHVVENLPGNRIIILPQTIHFRSQDAYVECCKIFSRHPDLHICVRDHSSYDLALPMSRHVYLLPDMAHQLWPIYRSRPAESGHLALLRRDKESAGGKVADFDVLIDWRELIGRKNVWFRNIRRGLLALHLMHLDRKFHPHEQDLWIKQATKLVNEAINFFSKFETVTTDRLHAHILACLMGISNAVLNNSYGKNYSYITAWTGSSNIVQLINADLQAEKSLLIPEPLQILALQDKGKQRDISVFHCN